MTAAQILEMAKSERKRDYRTYSSLKNMLSEVLDSKQYSKFIFELTKILKV